MNVRLVTASNITGHRTLLSWTCPFGHYNEGCSKGCGQCSYIRNQRNAQVHASERAVFYRHPKTGEVRRPPRADMPMDPKYVAQGFVREEVMSMLQHERETGSVHEATNFMPGNEPSPYRDPAPRVPKEVKEALIRDVRDACASGNWTLDSPLQG